MTVLEAIQKSADFLAKRDVESPRLQAELLLAHRLKMPRMKLYLNFDRPLSAEDTDTYREWVKRRSQREPLQHIIGSISFCGYEIVVNRHALVPRPETEILAESGWTFLATRDSANALDVGTGTGCIAIALAAKCPNAKIFASDISPDALALAKENAAKNNVQIEFLQGDGFAALPSDARFDLIISNPPYIPAAEIETLQPEVRDFDPRQALDGGADGLDFYRRFAAEAKTFLKPDGKIMLEFGDGQAPAIREIFENEKWIVEAVKDDYSQRARILIATWKVF
ncbi:MAG TPA: peptide chain release factor N(5)-glutamine methyltransferase [Candidatus Acidoferrales bacterium]|nr:peptide chain release factor N(5)-glutamine methyltransferase [Candidatus Acidoferrales bacterium]